MRREKLLDLFNLFIILHQSGFSLTFDPFPLAEAVANEDENKDSQQESFLSHADMLGDSVKPANGRFNLYRR